MHKDYIGSLFQQRFAKDDAIRRLHPSHWNGRQHLLSFGLPTKEPIAYLKKFLCFSNIVRINNIPMNVIRLRLFPSSVMDKALEFLIALPDGAITTWDEWTHNSCHLILPFVSCGTIGLEGQDCRMGNLFTKVVEEANFIIRIKITHIPLTIMQVGRSTPTSPCEDNTNGGSNLHLSHLPDPIGPRLTIALNQANPKGRDESHHS
ncbi:hypothetical protein CR513_31047, partial [Mucuna pruriens]